MDDDKTPDPTEVQPAWYLVRDAKGYGSITATMVFVSFWATTLAYLASVVQKVGPVQFHQFDSVACACYFTPICALYFGRRLTDAKLGTPQSPTPGS